MRDRLTWLCILPFVGLAVGQMGALHGFFDSVAVFRQVFFWWAMLSLVCFAIQRRSKWIALGGLYTLYIAITLWPIQYGVSTPLQAWGVYQKNLLFQPRDKTSLIKDVLAQNAQFVTLQEVSKSNRFVLEQLNLTYTAQHFCRFASVGGTAVLSTFPKVINSGGCVGTDGAAYMQVQTSRGPVWIISIHLHWPWPFRQQEQIDKILPKLAMLKGPKIIAGDFNMVPWTHLFHDIEQQLSVHRIQGIHRSFNLKGILNVPIDHVFYSWDEQTNTAETRAFLGSDHLGILAHIPIL